MVVRTKLRVKILDQKLKVIGSEIVTHDVRVSDKLKRGRKIAKAVYQELGKLPWKSLILEIVKMENAPSYVKNIEKDNQYKPKFYGK
jgi:hypothetical protein